MRRPLAALAVVGLVGAALARPAIAAPTPPRRAWGFDHNTHEGKVAASLVEAPTCADCHVVDAAGRPRPPGHAACFTAPCHGPPPGPPSRKFAGADLCLACHDQRAPARGARAVFPPYRVDPDHGLTFAHDRHADVGRGCEDCHRAPGVTRGRAVPTGTHARCVACHARTAPTLAPDAVLPAYGPTTAQPLSNCRQCHVAIAGRMVMPYPARSPFRVGEKFSHRTHAASKCSACHENVTRTSGDEIPAPPMASCQTCHDGRTAFAALAPNCRRCHPQSEGRITPPPAIPAPFDHETHASRGLPMVCETCHALDAQGVPRPASPTHAPCADAGCHADEFSSREPRICTGCHVGTEPWRPLHADAPRRAVTEFGVEFSHASHLGGERPRGGVPCADCHTGIAGGPDRRVGKGHAACSGDTCHARDRGPAPTFATCDGCHALGLLPARDRKQRDARWSVATRFRHRNHAADAAGALLPCQTCHLDVLGARRVADLASPAKTACAVCHDGATAFKMTGHGCIRCHGQ